MQWVAGCWDCDAVKYNLNRCDGITPRIRVIVEVGYRRSCLNLGRLFDLLGCSACVFVVDCSAWLFC